MMRKMILGLDLGGPVLHSPAGSSAKDYAAAVATPGALDSIRRLTTTFDLTIHLVSQCPPPIENIKRAWLGRKKFFEATGLHQTSLHFCRKPEEKALIARALNMTDFVDDRAEVLDFMLDSVQHTYLFAPNSDEVRRYPRVQRQAHAVANWADLLTLLEKRVKST